MSAHSTILDLSTDWDRVCFPVAATPLASLLTSPHQLPSDRQQAIIGEPVAGQPIIFAIQSSDYSLIPNSLIRDVANEAVPGHQVSAYFTPRGEFCLTLVLPDDVNEVRSLGGKGKVQDRLYRSLIINNSYSGKTPFTVQGLAEWEQKKTEDKMRVSYFREVCTNGLMGWADEYFSLDEYASWLAAGKPNKHKRVQQEKPAELVAQVTADKREQQLLLDRKFHHKGLDLELFQQHLHKCFVQVRDQPTALTSKLYAQLASKPLPVEREKLFASTTLPARLAKAALERLAYEETLLQTPANLWLAYNAANYALFNEKTSLTISERFRKDEQLFHHFAELSLA